MSDPDGGDGQEDRGGSLGAAGQGLRHQLFKDGKDGTNRYLQDRILPFTEFNRLIGLPEIRELESRFLPEETIQKKYGSAEGLTQEKAAGH